MREVKKMESDFSAVPGDQTRGNGCKLKYGKFHVNIRKSFFTERVVISHRGCRVTILVAIPNLTGQDPAQSALADHAFRRRVGPDYFQRYLPTSTILGLCEFTILVNCLHIFQWGNST